MRKLISILLLLSFFQFSVSKAETVIDSLKSVLSSSLEDTNRINILNKLCEEYFYTGEYETSLYYGSEANRLSKIQDYNKGIAYSSLYLGKIFLNNRKTDEARQHLLLALEEFNKLKHQTGVAITYGDIALTYKADENYEKIIEYYLNALKVHEKIDNKRGISFCLGEIGILYHTMGNYSKAVEYHSLGFQNDSLVGDSAQIANSLNDLGNAYDKSNQLVKALDCHERALKIRTDIQDEGGIGLSLANIAIINKQTEDFSKALEYYNKALEIFNKQNDSINIAKAFDNISEIYLKQKNYSQALNYAKQSLSLARQLNSMNLLKNPYKTLSEIYYQSDDYENAYNYFEFYVNTKDTLFNENANRNIARMQTIYETDKKQKEIELLNKDKEIAIGENKRQKSIIYFVIGGLLLVIVFSVFMFNRWRITQKQKRELSIKNRKIEIAYEIIEEKTKEITDSITYAKRIQTAVLPADKYADSILGEHFIIFRPHSVVSGDFYWATKIKDWTVVTVADCTGHGVPGAFMSMLGVSFLNEIVRKKEVTNTAEILNHLRTSIIEALQQTGEQGTQKDGMDMSIVAIHKNRKRILWAGANNPLWIIRQDVQFHDFEDKADMIEFIKGDNMPVAVHVCMDDFTNHEIELQKGDQLYMFSDGFPDQFGGSKGKKFKSKQFKRLIAEISILSMHEQQLALVKALDDWMDYNDPLIDNRFEQVDDITVIGIKI